MPGAAATVTRAAAARWPPIDNQPRVQYINSLVPPASHLGPWVRGDYVVNRNEWDRYIIRTCGSARVVTKPAGYSSGIHFTTLGFNYRVSDHTVIDHFDHAPGARTRARTTG